MCIAEDMDGHQLNEAHGLQEWHQALVLGLLRISNADTGVKGTDSGRRLVYHALVLFGHQCNDHRLLQYLWSNEILVVEPKSRVHFYNLRRIPTLGARATSQRRRCR